MLRVHQILASGIALAACVAALSACGQRGPLFLPSSPAASLPQTLKTARTLPAAPSIPPAPSVTPVAP